MEDLEELAKFSIDRSSQEVYWVNPEGEFVYTNKKVEDRLGYSEEELKGMSIWDVSPDYEKDSREERWQKLKEEKTMTFESEHETSDGEVYPVEITNHHIEFEGREYEFAFAKDISQRKEKEKELKRKNRYLDHTPEYVTVVDGEGQIKYQRHGFSDNVGLDLNEIIDSSGFEFVHPEDKEQVQELFSKVLENPGEQYKAELRGKSEDGWTWFEVRVVNYLDNPEIDGIITTTRDITERKEVEEKVKHQNELERIITEVSTNLMNAKVDEIDELIVEALEKIGVFANADRSYVFQFYDGFERMDNTHEWCSEGVDPQKDNLQDLSTDTFPWWMEKLKNFENIPIPKVSDLPSEAEAEEEILQAQNIKSLIVIPMISNGSLIGYIGFDWVENEEFSDEIISLLRIAGGAIASALDREKRDEEWRETFNTLEDSILILDKNHNIERVNDSFLKVLNISEEEALNRKCFELVHDQDQPIENCPLEESLRTGEGEKEEFYEPNLDKYILARTQPMTDKEGEIQKMVHQLQDITKLKEAEERKDFLNTLLRQDLASKCQTIRGYNQLLKDEVDLSDEPREYLRKAIRTGQESGEILGLAKKLEKIEETGWEAEKEVFEVLGYVLDDISDLVERKDVEIVKSYPESIGRVSGNYSLKTLITHLLMTRIRLGECNKIDIDARKRKEDILLRVDDDGKQLPEDAKKLFTGEVYKGETSGVGGVRYYMIKEIARHNNLDIGVKDSDLGGTRFDIHLQKA